MVISTIRINGADYAASTGQILKDSQWNNRGVILLRMALSMDQMQQLFPAGGKLQWATVQTVTEFVARKDEDGNTLTDENGQPIMDPVTKELVTDKSEYCLCGPIIDNRDGTYTVKMGKRLASEVQAELDEVSAQLANAVTAEELTAAYTEGVNSL